MTINSTLRCNDCSSCHKSLVRDCPTKPLRGDERIECPCLKAWFFTCCDAKCRCPPHCKKKCCHSRKRRCYRISDVLCFGYALRCQKVISVWNRSSFSIDCLSDKSRRLLIRLLQSTWKKWWFPLFILNFHCKNFEAVRNLIVHFCSVRNKNFPNLTFTFCSCEVLWEKLSPFFKKRLILCRSCLRCTGSHVCGFLKLLIYVFPWPRSRRLMNQDSLVSLIAETLEPKWLRWRFLGSMLIFRGVTSIFEKGLFSMFHCSTSKRSPETRPTHWRIHLSRPTCLEFISPIHLYQTLLWGISEVCSFWHI